MLNKSTLIFALCLLVIACSEPHEHETSNAPPSPTLATGPMTVHAPDGIEIAATVHSIGNPTVVLIHGWMCDQSYWQAQTLALGETFGVVTVDLAGHGLSGIARQTWTTVSLGEDVTAVINDLGVSNIIVAGHSMGGRVALEVARLLPEKVVGVIGVDTLHDADGKWDPEHAEGFLGPLEENFVVTCDSFVRSMFGKAADAALIDSVATDMCSGPGKIGAALMRDYVAYDLAATLQSVHVPIRCVNADLWPTNVEANKKYADFEAVILPGYGHFLMQEAPEALNQALIETVAAISANRQ